MFVSTNVGNFIIKPGLHDTHLMREARWIRVRQPQYMRGRDGDQVHDVHTRQQTVHTTRNKWANLLWRASKYRLSFRSCTRHPRADSFITRGKFTLAETYLILPRASNSHRVNQVLDFILCALIRILSFSKNHSKLFYLLIKKTMEQFYMIDSSFVCCYVSIALSSRCISFFCFFYEQYCYFFSATRFV